MPTKNENLHGDAPEKSPLALLLIDVINDLDFPDNEEIVTAAQEMAEPLLALKERAAAAGIPVIYVNDNFGRWRSDFSRQIDHCLRDGVPGKPLVERLRPGRDDYFVLKPKHSGFYSTTLGILLENLGARRLILTGIAGNICVLYTANDAYMRDYEISVPRDCIVSNTKRENDFALEHMARFSKADTRPSDEVTFEIE